MHRNPDEQIPQTTSKFEAADLPTGPDAPSESWPQHLRSYLSEQIQSAQNEAERFAALRLADALTVVNSN